VGLDVLCSYSAFSYESLNQRADVSARLLGELVTGAPPKDREAEAAKRRARYEQRFAA
jgi:hypothetical protein